MTASTEIVTKDELLSLPSPVTIDEVITHMEKIILWCEVNNNCAGYFAVLYHKVTCKIKDCINSKDFEDGVRMERLDVVFATRYIDAFHSWIGNKPLTSSWQIAFDCVTADKSLVLQHLLAGMNAHINLDLSIATAFVMRGFSLDDIHKDFNTINSILAAMIDNVEGCLTKVNPLMKLLHLDIYKYDEMLVQFSISTARDGAWSFSQELSTKNGQDYNNCIHARDVSISQLGNSIVKPRGLFLQFIVKLIRLFEKKNVAGVIKLLAS